MPYSRPFTARLPWHREQFNSTRLAGVEWEFNTCQNPLIEKWCKKWRGQRVSEHTGGEMITAPMAGDHIAECLQDLGKAFQTDTTISNNCGIHVHIDGEDLSWEDLYRLMWVYARVEDVLYRLGGEWRKTQTWCRPCGIKYRQAVAKRFESHLSPTDVQNEMLDAVYDGYGGRGYYPYNYRKDGARYQGLNLCPWLYAKRTNTGHQTVEFRMHENTSDADRVIQWTHLLVQLVDWVKKSNDEQARRLPKHSVKALCKIAPQSRKWIINRLRTSPPITPPLTLPRP